MMMMACQKTLLSYLTQKNPTLNIDNGVKGPNTGSAKRAWKEPNRISDWTDFQPESLTSMYGGQLKEALRTTTSCETGSTIPLFPFREIHDETSLESLLTLWTQQIVSKALAVYQDQIDTDRTSGRIYMARGGQAKFLESYPKNHKKGKLYPDWAAIKRSGCGGTTPLKSCNILPGDTKISSKWRSESVLRGNRSIYKETPNATRPIIQLFNYCLQANARYGYIITDRELVVLRIRASDTTDQQVDPDPEVTKESQDSQEIYASEAQKRVRKSGEVELMSISWDNHAEDDKAANLPLTVNLALWWLHILAATKSCIDVDYPKLIEEQPPTVELTNNASFDTKLRNTHLTPGDSFASQTSSNGQSDRKRKRNGKSPSHERSTKMQR